MDDSYVSMRLGYLCNSLALTHFNIPHTNFPGKLNKSVSIGGKMPTGYTLNILHDTFGRGLQLARVFWPHLRSIVTTMKAKHSLNHNIKSVPLVLTGKIPGQI
jgi:hypothetical protein